MRYLLLLLPLLAFAQLPSSFTASGSLSSSSSGSGSNSFIYGPENLKSPNFETPADWGTDESSFVISGNHLTYTDVNGSNFGYMWQVDFANAFKLDTVYQFSYTVSAVSATKPSRCETYIYGSGAVYQRDFPSLEVGPHIMYFRSDPTDLNTEVDVDCYSDGTGSGQFVTFSQFSIKEVTNSVPQSIGADLNFDLRTNFNGTATFGTRVNFSAVSGGFLYKRPPYFVTNSAFSYNLFQFETDPDSSPFNFGITSAQPVNGATRRDNIFIYGYNCSQTGGYIVNGDHRMCIVMESDWMTGSGGGQPRQMELYYAFAAANNAYQVRPFNIVPVITSPYGVNIYMDNTATYFRSDTEEERMRITGNGIIIPPLAGTGNAFACLDSNGKLYRSGTACN